MTDQNQLVDELRRRIADPGAILPRDHDRDDDGEDLYETIPTWSARAVAAGLEDGTLGYIPTEQRDSYKREVNALNDLLTTARADRDRLAAELATLKRHASHLFDGVDAAYNFANKLDADCCGTYAQQLRDAIGKAGTEPVPGFTIDPKLLQPLPADHKPPHWRDITDSPDAYACGRPVYIGDVGYVEPCGRELPCPEHPAPVPGSSRRVQEPAAVIAGERERIATWLLSLANSPNEIAAWKERHHVPGRYAGMALRGVADDLTSGEPVPGLNDAGESQASEPAPAAERLAATETESAWLRKRMPSLLIDKGMQAYEEAVAANRSSRDPYLATRAGVHAAMWEAHVAAQAGEPAAPKLAQGGIIRSNKLAIVGEQPSDCVVPVVRPIDLVDRTTVTVHLPAEDVT